MITARDPDFDFIRQLVYDHSSIHLGDEKREMVYARLTKRLTHLGLATVAEYCDLLRSGRQADELTQLIDVLSTNFTTFFRELEHFKFLKDEIIPEFLASGAAGRDGPFRSWSAACSTGEEPYSLAIVLAACFQVIGRDAWDSFATDISTRVLAKARRAIYESKRVSVPNQAWLNRYFQKGSGEWEGHYRVKKQLRDQIRFEHMNLLSPGRGVEGKFHVIFCRNVMIYFDEPTMQQLVIRLDRQLHEGGYLIIGHAENLSWRPRGMEQIRTSVYRKTSG